VGSLKPNDFGLFDIQGNVSEWCYDAYLDYPSDSEGPVDDAPETGAVQESISRVLRGGPYNYPAKNIRSAFRNFSLPVNHTYNYGFRPVRTYDSAVQRLQRAHALSEEGKFDEAIQQYRASIEELPIAAAYFGLAKTLGETDKFDEARMQYRIAIQLLSKEVGEEVLQRPESPDGVRISLANVYLSLARLERETGDREAETFVWERVVDLLEKKPDPENLKYPENVVYWGVLGQGLYRVGRFGESRQALEKANALRSETNPTIRGGPRWWYLTMALGQLGETVKTRQYYDSLVEELGENPSEALLRYQIEAAETLGIPADRESAE
jgi:tetratricopeptide (TPR) repeat protein